MPSKDTHNFVGLSWLILFAFFVFWLFTTGEFKQYIPTTRKMLAIGRYYSYGIFHGESHPVLKHREAKHNPGLLLFYSHGGCLAGRYARFHQVQVVDQASFPFNLAYHIENARYVEISANRK